MGKELVSMYVSLLNILSTGACDIGNGYNGSDCSPCPKGSYKSSTGNDVCDSCGTSYTTSSKESTDQTQCMNPVFSIVVHKDVKKRSFFSI